MKKIIAAIGLLSLITFTACEKVIEVELRDSDKKLVIEGVITDQSGRTEVRISQTKSYNSSNDFEGISGATVYVTEEGASTTRLIETSTGVYTADLIGTPGKKYSLVVTVNGKQYDAISQMPEAVEIDSLYISEISMGSETNKYVNVVYEDPQVAGNNYRFVQFQNGVREKTIFTRNDDLSNGRTTTAGLHSHDMELKKGDSVFIELLSIDSPVYKYWYSLDQGADGGGDSPSPANPVSNLSGGALGYFSAHTVRGKLIVVK